ncbi:MAG: ABC transporter ATP-binding protein/permease [Oscillospiraceae bacterium]|nr:ABC transporter ATP-binding protein/permease [Oscillospiraceae bacterium]
MLKLKNITKVYEMGDMTVEALKDVSLDFRKSEFVAVLGPSGCGKTTLLNIVGGLDRYTSGDLVINGVSTKRYKDVDWDIYRNNSIGFVFQSYNLIPHQTALANVELAMTLAGISKSERRKRAIEILEAVGLHDQLYKKPGQMSGGQMQRVSIARALVNNPDILLADEPTGALDSETSVQIMEILKSIAKDRLVIMVTHNPDLANRYSNRIIRLLDGRVTDDTHPFRVEDAEEAKPKKRKKISMSFFTALSLSLNNLLTKKTRTVLTAFAGSIGIIGIALIMSLSSGMQGYINTLEQDTLSTYPVTLQSQAMDITAMMGSQAHAEYGSRPEREPDRIYATNIMTNTIRQLSSLITRNDLALFKAYIEDGDGRRLNDYVNAVQYGYSIEPQFFHPDTSKGVLQLNPSDFFASLGQYGYNPGGGMNFGVGEGFAGDNVFTELLTGGDGLFHADLLQSQYDLLDGRWPEAFDEVVLVAGERNDIIDFHLYALGLLDADELEDMLTRMFQGEDLERDRERISFSFDELLGLTFKLALNTDYYVKEGGLWTDMRDDDAFMRALIANALDVKIVGILRPNEEAMAASINGTIGYTHALTEYVINAVLDSEIAKDQLENPDSDVFTGLAFDAEDAAPTIEDVYAYVATLTEEEQAQFMQMASGRSEEEIIAMFAGQLPSGGNRSTYEDNLETLGVVNFDSPSSISLYPKDFASKEEISALIEEYNETQRADDAEENVIRYTDLVGLMTSGISQIINVTSYVLIAFVSISLIVSSIMIAIITYISVLERTREIGILRSIGAAKRDISRVFNAETLIEGFVAGVLGIGITLLLNIPANIIIKNLTDISGLSSLPPTGAALLILLSMFLTVLAGFIPSKIAAKKDPVVALRAE